MFTWVLSDKVSKIECPSIEMTTMEYGKRGIEAKQM